MKNVALIGLGMVSGTYADALKSLSKSMVLTRVHSWTCESMDRFVANHGTDHPSAKASSLTEIAEDPDLDFVILATPPSARLQIVETLAKAGKPILMEKPVARNLAEAVVLVKVCEDAKIPLGIVLQHRARPIVAGILAHMPDLGPLHSAEINVPWWRPQSYYDEPGRGSYDRDGGGVLISQAIHTLDLMLKLTGPVTEVTAMSATTGFHDMEAEDFVTAGLRFENGAVGQLFATTASYPGKGETITLHHANASAHLDAGTLVITRHNGWVETLGQSASSGAGADPMAFTSDWHAAIIADFADSLTEKRPPMIPGRDALPVHRLIDALERSAKKRKTVKMQGAE